MQHNSRTSYFSEESVAAVQAQAQKPAIVTDPKKEAARKKAEQMSTRIAQMNVQLAKQKAQADIAYESKNVYRGLADAYVSMYEAKKVDQDQDGDTDFADVQIVIFENDSIDNSRILLLNWEKEQNNIHIIRCKENCPGSKNS